MDIHQKMEIFTENSEQLWNNWKELHWIIQKQQQLLKDALAENKKLHIKCLTLQCKNGNLERELREKNNKEYD